MGFRIWVTVKPNSKKDEIQRNTQGSYLVRIKAPAREGRANQDLVRALAAYFSVSNSAVRIIHGQSGRRKLVEIG
jgi:uncharacterized protein (TIGR00251 family)